MTQEDKKEIAEMIHHMMKTEAAESPVEGSQSTNGTPPIDDTRCNEAADSCMKLITENGFTDGEEFIIIGKVAERLQKHWLKAQKVSLGNGEFHYQRASTLERFAALTQMGKN